MSEASPDAVTNRRRWRFGVRDVIWLQLLIAPAFLAPVYARHHSTHPYLQLLALLVAPACYITAMMAIAPPHEQPRSPTLIAKVKRGALYGMLFGSLSLVPVTVYEMSGNLHIELQMLGNLYDALFRAQVWADPIAYLFHLVSTFAPFVLVPLFILLHYALIGAVTGGVAGIARDSFTSLRRVCAAK